MFFLKLGESSSWFSSEENSTAVKLFLKSYGGAKSKSSSKWPNFFDLFTTAVRLYEH